MSGVTNYSLQPVSEIKESSWRPAALAESYETMITAISAKGKAKLSDEQVIATLEKSVEDLPLLVEHLMTFSSPTSENYGNVEKINALQPELNAMMKQMKRLQKVTHYQTKKRTEEVCRHQAEEGKALVKKCDFALVQLKNTKKQLLEIEKSFESDLIEMIQLLKVAEEEGIELSSLSEKGFEHFMTRQSAKAYRQLQQEEASLAKQKKKVKTKPQKTPNSSEAAPIVASNPSFSLSETPEQEKNPACLRQMKLHEWKTQPICHFRIDPRMDRWETDDLEKIKQFEDRNPIPGGAPLKQYANYTPEKLLTMKAYHYLPGTENFFLNPIYGFNSTRTGATMLCCLHRESLPAVYGKLRAGFKDDLMYHLCLKEKTSADSQLFQLFQEASDQSHFSAAVGGGEWTLSGKYSAEPLENGVIKISYANKSFIEIFPVRPHLLLPQDGFLKR